MKLYYSPGLCSLAPHIVLREAGLPVELIKVDIQTHTLQDGRDYFEINPRGYVPVLELDDGQRFSEGPAIVQLIADRAPQTALAPANGSLQRYRLQEWLGFINSELHKNYSPLFDPSQPDSVKLALRHKIGKRLDWVAAQLHDSDHVLGKRFSVADAYLFTILRWSPYVGIDLAHWPVLRDYMESIAARPAVQEALRAEGLTR